MQALESIRDFFKHKYYLGMHFGHKWFTRFGGVSWISKLCHAFFGWGFILGHGTYQWYSFVRKHTCCIDIFSSCVIHWPFYFIQTICPFSSFLSFLTSFNKRVMKVCGDIMHPRSWESIQGPLMGYHVQLLIYFHGISLLSIKKLCPIYFSKGIRLWFHICVLSFVFFIDPFWKSMFFRLKGGPHLF